MKSGHFEGGIALSGTVGRATDMKVSFHSHAIESLRTIRCRRIHECCGGIC